MKTTAFLLLFTLSLSCCAQIMPTFSTGITLMPDYGAGIICTRYFNHVGIYASYGHTIMNFSKRYGQSEKVSLGIDYIIFQRNTFIPAYLSVGTSYNRYNETVQNMAPNYYTTMPFDLQLGCGMMLKSLDVGVRYDAFKKDASIDLQWNIGKQFIKYKLKKHGR